MPREPLIPAGAAERAALRGWLAEDADHATLAVLHGRYDTKTALHHLITASLCHAERAKILERVAREVAVDLFWETLNRHEAAREAAEREKRRDKPFVPLRSSADAIRRDRAAAAMRRMSWPSASEMEEPRHEKR